MKNTKKLTKVLAISIFVMFITNLLTPTVVFAAESINSGGTIELSIERRVLGQEDIMKSAIKEIIISEKASVSIDRIFKEAGIEYGSTGTLESNFYIASIKTPEGDSLEEFDHGSYSGWKYSVNGVYPDIGLADYKFKDGDKVRIQYTAKDMGQDILVVDSIYKIREMLVEAEKFSKDDYTEESFNKLQSEITKIKGILPNDIEIGEMMSDELGNGDCDTFEYGKQMDELLLGLENAISDLVEKPVEPELPQITPEFEINIFRSWDKVDDNDTEQPNIVYLQEGQKSIGAKIVGLSSTSLPVMYDGKELAVVEGSALVEVTPGIHTLSVKRWGKPYEITIKCVTLPYTIEGDLIPGGTVVINFNGGVEEGIKNGRYELKETSLEYNTNIPELKTVGSETIIGGTVDREKLSKVTFKIPKNTEPGEYELTNGSVNQKWDYRSYNGGFSGKFSVLPNIKLKIESKVDLSNAYSINLNNWSEFDKVYTTEDKTLLKLDDISTTSNVLLNGKVVYPIDDVYVVEVSTGNNKISIDDKEYTIDCKKVSYSIENANKIIPGTEVKVNFKGLEKAFGYIENNYNPNLVKTIFKSNIAGLDKIESMEAGSGNNINDEILNQVIFTIPEGTTPGTYELFDGTIYQEWNGTSIPGKEGNNFSIIPNVKFNVRETIPEDNIAPEISTTLKDGTIVTKEKLSFTVVVTDDVDGELKPEVKLNGDIVESANNGQYTVILKEGVNNIQLSAMDEAGNESKKELTIKYEPKIKEGNSIILDTLSLQLNVGEKHQIIAVDSPDSRSNEKEDTLKMTYTLTSGKDVVKVNGDGLIEAVKPGFAEISVKYAGLTIPAILQVQVNDSSDVDGPEFTTSIKESKYDTLYYNGKAYDYNFTVDAPNSKVEVSVNNKKVYQLKGNYNVNLTEGYNKIEIKATKDGKSSYKVYNLKAKKLETIIENLTNPGKDIIQGDKVKISFKGLETPVPKFLRVFNPKRTRVEYKTDLPGATNIYGQPTQYNIATNNAIEFIANTAGVVTFTGGNIEEAWWGDELYSERDISNDGPNMSAVVRQGNFSRLPDFSIKIKENKDYQNKYTVEVLNKDSIKAGDIVTLKINNLEMPEVEKGRILQAQTVFNTNIDGLNEIKSEDAANDFTKLQTISFKIPEGTKAGSYTITNGRVFKEWEPGVLYVDSEFYKGELPEVTLQIIEEEIPVPPIEPEVPVDVVTPSMTVDEGINHAIKWTMENVKTPTYGDEWDILGLVRSGLFEDQDYLDSYYNNLVEVVKDKKGVLTRNKYTEYSRTIIAVTALGKDPKNVGGYDLVENLYDFDKVSRQGINGVIFALIALDTNNYEIPKDASNSREKMIQAIVDSQLKDGGFALTGTAGNVDVTGMAIQALAKYKEDPKVEKTIDKAITFLSEVQLSDGGYSSDNVKNIEASVQVIVGLTTLGINPKSQAFVKDKNWIVSDIMNFADKKGGFKHSLDQNEANDMATEQALYGLVSYKRFTNGETALYDMSDVDLDGNEDTDNNSGDNNGDNGQGNGDNSGDNNGDNSSNNDSALGNQGGAGSSEQVDKNPESNKPVKKPESLVSNKVTLGQGSTNNKVDASNKNNIQKDSKDEEVNKNSDENKYLSNNTEPLSNIQVVFLTLAAVLLVLVIKEVIVIQYKKRKTKSK